MKRSTPLRRTGFAQGRPVHVRTPLQLVVVGTAPVAKMRPSRARHAPRPKRPYVRSRQLLDNVRLVPFCSLCFRVLPVVACHSNWAVHGKGGHIKADDNRIAAGCSECHRALDQGGGDDSDMKKAWWWSGHWRTVQYMIANGLWPAGVPVPDTSYNPFEVSGEPAAPAGASGRKP